MPNLFSSPIFSSPIENPHRPADPDEPCLSDEFNLRDKEYNRRSLNRAEKSLKNAEIASYNALEGK
jgi:hypothetical protein